MKTGQFGPFSPVIGPNLPRHSSFKLSVELELGARKSELEWEQVGSNLTERESLVNSNQTLLFLE